MSDKMSIYNAARGVPANAIKKITGGAYGAAGLSDVNHQWRIERMTEIFGAVGDGWVWEPIEQWVENGVHYAHVAVQYKKADGEYSLPVHGYGGTKVGGKDDSDLLKSSMTDALSNALRYLGVGADVWYSAGKSAEQNQFDTKYSSPGASERGKTQKRQEKPAETGSKMQKRQEKPAETGSKMPPAPLISEGQKKFLYATCTEEQIEALKTKYKLDSLNDMLKATASKIIEQLQARKEAS